MEKNQPELKVSITARLAAALCYSIPAFGAVLSSLMMMNMFRALRNSESAGIAVVLISMAESMYPALAALYLGIIGGFIVMIVLIVRALMETKTASPSSWFFIVCGLLLLVPSGLFFEAESMIIEVLINPMSSTGIAGVASNVSLFLILSIASAFFVFIVMVIMAVIPFSAGSKPKWSPLITATLVEFLLIAAAVVFQLRLLWLFKAV